MSTRQRIFGTSAEQMCTYVRTFVQFQFINAQFFDALGTILPKSQGPTREFPKSGIPGQNGLGMKIRFPGIGIPGANTKCVQF